MTKQGRTSRQNDSSRSVDLETFRSVVGHFTSGVTVITTNVGGELFGTTASAVSSLSLQPPMMIACLNRSSATHDAVNESGRYAINILSQDQAHLASRFAQKGADKFDGVAFTLTDDGIPLLDGALATIVCRVTDTAVGGTHSVFLGQVQAAESHSGDPLTYFRGTFGRFQHAHELISYEGTREWVLRRRDQVGTALQPQRIAEEIHSDAELVQNALIKLSTESLVSRNESGAYTQTPITSSFTDSLYDGRATIEAGVLETRFHSLSDDDIKDLTGLTAEIEKARSAGSLDSFLQLNAQYHARLVRTAGSKELSESHRRLYIESLWRHALNEAEWRQRLDTVRIQPITDAIVNRDLAQAKVALREFTSLAKALGQAAIARHGGSV